MIAYLVPLALVLGLLVMSIRILPEYERGVIFFWEGFRE